MFTPSKCILFHLCDFCPPSVPSHISSFPFWHIWLFFLIEEIWNQCFPSTHFFASAAHLHCKMNVIWPEISRATQVLRLRRAQQRIVYLQHLFFLFQMMKGKPCIKMVRVRMGVWYPLWCAQAVSSGNSDICWKYHNVEIRGFVSPVWSREHLSCWIVSLICFACLYCADSEEKKKKEAFCQDYCLSLAHLVLCLHDTTKRFSFNTVL